jgi:hypothetical protein
MFYPGDGVVTNESFRDPLPPRGGGSMKVERRGRGACSVSRAPIG